MVGEDAHGRGVAGAVGQVQVSDLRQQVEIAASHALLALWDSAAEREGDKDREGIIFFFLFIHVANANVSFAL